MKPETLTYQGKCISLIYFQVHQGGEAQKNFFFCYMKHSTDGCWHHLMPTGTPNLGYGKEGNFFQCKTAKLFF